MKNYDELKWYVLRHDFNEDKIVKFNIFNHTRLKDMIEKELKNFITFNAFKERLKEIFRYCFNSQVEYEIMMSGVIRKESYKISIYNQLEPNIDLIAKYIIDKYNERKRNKLNSE